MITDADVKKLKVAFAPQFEQLNKKIEQVSQEVVEVSQKVEGVNQKVEDVNKKVDDLKTRIDVLEDNLTGEIAKLQDENLVTSQYSPRIENHEERLAILEQNIATWIRNQDSCIIPPSPKT